MDQHYGNRMTNNDSPQTTKTSTSQAMPKTAVAPVIRRKNTRRRHHRRGRTPPKWLRDDHNDLCGDLTMITGLETLRHLGLQRHHRHHRHRRHHQPRHPKNTVSTTNTNKNVGTLPSLTSSSTLVGTTQNNQLLRWQESLDGILSNDMRTTLSFPSIEWDGDEGNESQEETLGGGGGGQEEVSDHHIHHQFSSSSSSLSYGCTMDHHDENDTMKDDEDEDECYRSLNNLSHGLLELSINLPPHNRRRHHHRHYFPPHHHPFLHRTLAFDSNLSSLGQA